MLLGEGGGGGCVGEVKGQAEPLERSLSGSLNLLSLLSPCPSCQLLPPSRHRATDYCPRQLTTHTHSPSLSKIQACFCSSQKWLHNKNNKKALSFKKELVNILCHMITKKYTEHFTNPIWREAGALKYAIVLLAWVPLGLRGEGWSLPKG